MAISTLLPAGGANDNRPNLKQFFGRNPDTANDNVQRVSSGMFSNTFVDSVVSALQGLVQEIEKITEIAQKVIASFGTIVKSLKNLNKDITSRFRVLNTELNASRIDFIRAILAIPKEKPVSLGKPETYKEQLQKTDAAETPGLFGDLLGGLFEKLMIGWIVKNLGEGAIKLLQGLLQFAKSTMVTLIKFVAETLPRLLALLEGALTGPTAATIANGLRAAIFNPVTLAAGGFIALAYWAGKQREADPEGWFDFQLKLRGAGARASIIKGPQAETDKLGPVQETGRIQPAQFLKANGLTKDDVDKKNSTGDIVTLKDGRWFDTKAKTTELQSPETNPIVKTKGKPTAAAPAAPAATTTAGAPMPAAAASTSAPAALGSTGAGGFSLGGVTGSPPPAANQNGMPAGEVKNESNTPAPPPGAPSAKGTTTTPPIPAAGPSGGAASAGGGVAVVQNSSVQNVGSVAGAETGGMTGQNLPMFVRNSKLQSTFGMQNVKYQ